MLNLAHYKRMCRPHRGCHYFGGDSSSQQSTENNDMRVVGGDNSTNQSIKVGGSNNVVTSTDHGAVAGSLQLAMKGVEQANQTTQQALSTTGGLLEGALKNSGEQAQQFTETIKDIKTSDVRVLVIAGLAVVGIAGVMVFKKG